MGIRQKKQMCVFTACVLLHVCAWVHGGRHAAARGVQQDERRKQRDVLRKASSRTNASNMEEESLNSRVTLASTY